MNRLACCVRLCFPVYPTLIAAFALCGVCTSWAARSPSTTSLAVSSAGSPASSITAGTVVTLTAQVAAATHSPVSSGQVKFCDAAAARCEDSAILATAQLTSSGIATFKFVPGIGNHSYQAVFVGTNAFAVSRSSTATLTVTGKYPSMTTFTSTGPLDDLAIQAAVVGTGVPPPTGTVTFKDVTNGMQLGTASLGAATRASSFPLKSFSSGDDDFFNMLLVDVNGDGIKDLVRLAQETSGVKVQLGKGDGTFGAASIVYSGDATSIVAGDFNGDGITDIAVGSEFSGEATVTVLLGQGQGTFKAQTPIVLNGSYANPLYLVTGDVNGDGIADLVAGVDGTLTVLLGTASGTFNPQSSTDTPYKISALYEADFNGDGVPDLIVMNQDEGAAVYLGSPSGTFTTMGELDTLAIAASIADFNGDGIPDLTLVESAESNVLKVLLGNGDGTFTFKSAPADNYYTDDVVAADFNGDGIQDLAVSTNGNSYLLLGNGDGTFVTGPLLFNSSALFPRGFVVGDLNGDGFTDVLAYSSDGTIAAVLNQPTETATATLSSASLPSSPTQYVTAAYPGDANYVSSVSPSMAPTSSQAATTLLLSSGTNPSTYGNLITLTATLSPYSMPGVTSNGEVLTFYNAGSSIGTGTLSSGVATLKIAYLPVSTDQLTAKYGGDANFTGAISNTVAETVTVAPGPWPTFVVTVTTDDATGNQYNCTGTGTGNCSLRDAIAAAAGAGEGNITFSKAIFGGTSPAPAIQLAASLTIASNTSITAPTAGNTNTQQMVQVNGDGSDTAVKVNAGTTNVVISGLSIGGGSNYGAFYSGPGGGIYNDGALNLSNVTISGFTFLTGGGIYNGTDALGTIDDQVCAKAKHG